MHHPRRFRPLLAASVVLFAGCQDALPTESPARDAPSPALEPATSGSTTGVGIVDLGVLPGAAFEVSWASAINDRGEIVGWSIAPQDWYTPVRWTNRGIEELPVNPWTPVGGATAINDRGRIAGMTDPPNNDAFLWTKSGYTGLGEFHPQSTTFANAINRSDAVVGSSSDDPFGNYSERPFIWTSGRGMRDLGSLGGNRGSANAINDLGWVVGQSMTATGSRRAFIWTPGTGIDELPVSGMEVTATGINDLGVVVGYRTVSFDPLAYEGFVWSAVTGTSILTAPGGGWVAPLDINNFGEIVGYFQTPEGHRRAMHWSPITGLTELGTLGGPESFANAINDRGDIVGTSQNTAGLTRAVRWTLGKRFPAWLPLFSRGPDGGEWRVTAAPMSHQELMREFVEELGR